MSSSFSLFFVADLALDDDDDFFLSIELRNLDIDDDDCLDFSFSFGGYSI